MPRPRTPKQALRLGLSATLTLLLGACQPLESTSASSGAAPPEPEPVVVAVMEPQAPVAPEPSPPRPVAPAPGAAKPGTAAGGAVVRNTGTAVPSTNIQVGSATRASQGIGKSSKPVIAKVSKPETAATTSVPETAAPDLAALAETAASVEEPEPRVAETAAAPAPPIPQFPWPPPRASASAVIPAGFLRPSEDATPTLGDVAGEISAALDTGGYFERSYFGAPGGYAMVTRLERINPDGTPKDEAERWTVGQLPLSRFSLADYLRALFTAPSGHYRIIVFVVSSQPFAQSETEVERSEALAWLSEGLNRLPDNIALAPFGPQHTVTALIYEFEQPGSQEAMLMLPGNLMGRVHLQRAQLWDALRQ